MTLVALMVSDVTDVFLRTDDFASSVLKYVGGNDGAATTITAIITLHPVEPDDNRGRGYVLRAAMDLSEDVIITAQDAIKYDGNRYEVESVGDAEHGMRTVMLIRYQPESQGVRPLKTGDH